jgi:hypothetical protein
MAMMAETLTFTALHKYDTRELGITVPVMMKIGNKSVRFSAKVDTGASVCIFDRARGEALGLDIESGLAQEITTATGNFLTYGHEVTLSVTGIETYTTVYFAADDNFTKNVLGRQGWLERVRLGLVDYEGKLYLSSYNDETR